MCSARNEISGDVKDINVSSIPSCTKTSQGRHSGHFSEQIINFNVSTLSHKWHFKGSTPIRQCDIDRGMVVAAVTRRGAALAFASESLRHDLEVIVLTAP